MRLPLRWLNEYVSTASVTTEQLKNKLFSCGFEVEEVIEINKNVKKIVTCRILDKARHPAADKLFVCQVDAGKYGILQIVTNAVNVQTGDIVPVAVDGAVLADGTVIKNGKLRGVGSFGMFCGGAEIGITDEYYDGASGDSVLIFHDDFPLGEEVADLLDIRDTVFDISVTANRPDCQSLLGMAREVAAILKQPLKMPDTSFEGEKGVKTQDKIKVFVKDKELCPRYMAAYCYDIKIAPSPKWMQRRLYLMGVRAINNIVDITNYVLNEIGQPMHAFDYRELTGGEIVVRRANEGEKIVTLDEKEFTLTSNNLVICDKDKPSALAGIMGGKGSGIKEDTAAIVFESAKFKRDNVRRTSRTLNQRSDSSARFEKGVDDASPELGLKRALSLIESLGAGKVADGIIDENATTGEKKIIKTSTEKINKLLGITVPDDVMVEILERLEFKCTLENGVLTAEAPAYREDVEDYPDLAEEIIRTYGYEHINSTLLEKSAITMGGRNAEQIKENEAKRYLASVGFDEIITYSFISPKDYTNFGYEVDKLKLIRLKNPLGEDVSVMRTTLLPSVVAAVARNLNKKNLSGRVFEVAKVYLADKLPLESYPTEQTNLCVALFGDDENFFTAKGAIEGTLNHLCFECSIKYERSNLAFLHPTRGADIIINGETLGYVGELNPITAEKLGIDKRVYVAEINYQKAFEYFTRTYTVKAFSKFPSVERDIALSCPLTLTNGEIMDAINSAKIKTLVDCKLFDVYTGERIMKGTKSMAYRLTFSSMEKTLDDEEIERYMRKILARLNEIGAQIR